MSPGLLAAGAVVALVLLNVVIIPFRHNEFGWQALTRSVDETMVPLTKNEVFEPGATYRILRVADGKVGMYQLIRGGARLDSEFFPESINRRSWPDSTQYAEFLRGRKVQYVIIYKAYDRRYQTNERELLETLRRAPAITDDGELCTDLVGASSEYSVYRVVVGKCPVYSSQPKVLD
jgi:hypothetical protein